MTTDATASHRPARQVPPLLGALTSRQFFLVLINLAIFLALTALRPDAFPSWTNLKAVLSLMSYDLLIAIAMTIVLIVRGIDLSVGSVLALSSVTMALLMRGGTPVISCLAGRTDGRAALRVGQRTARRGRRNSAVPRHAGNDVGRARNRDRPHDRTIHFVSERRSVVHAVRAIRVSDTERLWLLWLARDAHDRIRAGRHHRVCSSPTGRRCVRSSSSARALRPRVSPGSR